MTMISKLGTLPLTKAAVQSAVATPVADGLTFTDVGRFAIYAQTQIRC